MTKKNHQRILLATVVAFTVAIQVVAQPSNVGKYSTRLLGNEQQIESIIKSMTLEEKVAMLHGKNMFSSAGIPRLGIADMEYADGPFGIREEMEPHSWNSAHLTTDSATFFPTGSALAATWSTLSPPDNRLSHVLPHRLGIGCYMEHRLGLCLRTRDES